jgi:hypothetical protein
MGFYKSFYCYALIGENMGKWSRETENIVEFAILSIFGFGIGLYLGSVFLQALPSGSTAYNAVNSIIGGFSTAITNVLVPIIAIVFVLFLYLIVKHSGILGGKKGTHE